MRIKDNLLFDSQQKLSSQVIQCIVWIFVILYLLGMLISIIRPVDMSLWGLGLAYYVAATYFIFLVLLAMSLLIPKTEDSILYLHIPDFCMGVVSSFSFLFILLITALEEQNIPVVCLGIFAFLSLLPYFVIIAIIRSIIDANGDYWRVYESWGTIVLGLLVSGIPFIFGFAFLSWLIDDGCIDGSSLVSSLVSLLKHIIGY